MKANESNCVIAKRKRGVVIQIEDSEKGLLTKDTREKKKVESAPTEKTCGMTQLPN